MCDICNNKKNCSCNKCPVIKINSQDVIYDGPSLPRLDTVTGAKLTEIIYKTELNFDSIYTQLDIYKKEVVVLTANTTLDISYNGKIIFVANNPGITITIPLGLTKNIQFTFDTNIGFTLAVEPGVNVTGNALPMPYVVPVNVDMFAYFTATNEMRLKRLS